eukprot:1655052-Amphidinium_carterae.1
MENIRGSNGGEELSVGLLGASHGLCQIMKMFEIIVLTALLTQCSCRPTLHIAVVHAASRTHPGVEFVGLDRFEAIFGANRTILPDHDVVFHRVSHGGFEGDAAEVFAEIATPWSVKYAAAVGFCEDSVNETARLAATHRILQ